jgi:hypothetical protein
VLLQVRVLEDLFEQVLQVEYVVGDEADELLEAAVFFAGDLAVEDVVEEKLRHHGRDHLVDLPPGEVDQHALQPADLTGHVQSHARAILQWAKSEQDGRGASGDAREPHGMTSPAAPVVPAA